MSLKHGSKRSKKETSAQQVLQERKMILNGKSDFYLREAYKALRTNVNFATADAESSKVILLTSALQGEGKSITAVNLAISLAEDGFRVILVDCDLRRPKLGRLLDTAAPCGLSDLLIQPDLMDRAIVNYRSNLDVLFSGRIPPNPSELLGSNRMERLLATLRGKYDTVIVDTPPVNMVTDAAVLAGKTDGVLFIVRANQSERGAVVHAVEQLEYAKAKILGFVLNGTSTESGSYGKYKYKRYGRYGYKRYGYNHYYGKYSYGYHSGYDSGYGYGSRSGYGYGYGSDRGYGYGYGYGSRGDTISREDAQDAVTRAAEEARAENYYAKTAGESAANPRAAEGARDESAEDRR